MPPRLTLLSMLTRRARRGTSSVATLAGLLLGNARGAGTQGVIPQGAPRDMSKVALRDSTIFPPVVTREFRGAWLSPAADGDWPSRPACSGEAAAAELITLLDRARTIGLNAIIFHVRLSGDALYATPLAPWSAKLMARKGYRRATIHSSWWSARLTRAGCRCTRGSIPSAPRSTEASRPRRITSRARIRAGSSATVRSSGSIPAFPKHATRCWRRSSTS